MEDDQKKWKTNQSTKINLIGCDTIVNSPSLMFVLFWGTDITKPQKRVMFESEPQPL